MTRPSPSHGLTVMVFAAAFADISGAHFNPAVTIGLATAGAFPSRHVLIAQLAGSIVAAWVLLLAFDGRAIVPRRAAAE